MAHIVIDARIINSSTGTYVQKLLDYLDKIDRKHTYTVLVPSKDINFWRPQHKSFTIAACDIKNYSFAEQTAFKPLLENLKPDLVHFCMPQQPVLYRGKKVTTVHDLTLLKTYNSDKNWLAYHLKQLVGRFVFTSVAKHSSLILTPTEFTKKEFVDFSGIDESKVRVTYEAAEAVKGSLEPYNQPFTRYLLYVGQQSDYKNIARLGDAHQKLLETYPDLGLILVGKINESAQKNKTYFESKGYKNIHFTGFVSNEQRDYLYTKAVAYVFPSLMEGFGLPGLEAMTYGTPVISSNATCLPEVYGDAAEYFDPTNTEEMTRAIEAVISSDTKRQELIQRGYKQLQKYSWEKMACETLAAYNEALGEAMNSPEK